MPLSSRCASVSQASWNLPSGFPPGALTALGSSVPGMLFAPFVASSFSSVPQLRSLPRRAVLSARRLRQAAAAAQLPARSARSALPPGHPQRAARPVCVFAGSPWTVSSARGGRAPRPAGTERGIPRVNADAPRGPPEESKGCSLSRR